MRVHPNDCESGQTSHHSVFITLKRGDYDAILPWPFKKKVTFILIDQHDSQHQQESVTTELITGSHLENFKRPAKKGERRNGLSSIRIPENFIQGSSLWMTLCLFRLKSDLNPLYLLVYLISSIFHVLDKYQRILKVRITLIWTKPCIAYVYLDIWV